MNLRKKKAPLVDNKQSKLSQYMIGHFKENVPPSSAMVKKKTSGKKAKKKSTQNKNNGTSILDAFVPPISKKSSNSPLEESFSMPKLPQRASDSGFLSDDSLLKDPNTSTTYDFESLTNSFRNDGLILFEPALDLSPIKKPTKTYDYASRKQFRKTLNFKPSASSASSSSKKPAHFEIPILSAPLPKKKESQKQLDAWYEVFNSELKKAEDFELMVE